MKNTDKKQVDKDLERVVLMLKLLSVHKNALFRGQVYNMNSENSELALVKLMELFNYSSIAITKRNLGLRQQDILETPDCLIS